MGGTLINLNGSNPAAPSGSTNVAFQASTPYTGASGYEQRDVSASVGAIPQSQVTGLATSLAALAPLASPALTGTPTVPTAATGTNTTQAASTAFVQAQIAADALAPLASPALTGTPTAPTPATDDNSTKIATTAFVNAEMAANAPGLAASQSANKVYAGPTSGSAAAPSFRSLVAADVPATLNATQVAGQVDFGGSTTITSSPTAGSENEGWKVTLWGGSFALGIALNTVAILSPYWVSVFASPPANNSTTTAPDTNAKVTFGYDGSVRATSFYATGSYTGSTYAVVIGAANTLNSGSLLIGNQSANAGSSRQTVIGTGGGSIRGITSGLFSVGDNGYAWLAAFDTSGNLGVSGQMYAGGFNNTSDAQLKRVLAPVTDVLAKLARIQPVIFEWNEKGIAAGETNRGPEIGLLAQEVQEQFPELVSGPNADGYLTLDYGRVTAVLLQGIKELAALVAALTKERK